MLHAIILKFELVDAQSKTFFVRLVISLGNDNDRKVRSMSAAAIKCLVGHVSPNSLHSILDDSLSWYFCGKQNLCGAAAQVNSVKIISLNIFLTCVFPDLLENSFETILSMAMGKYFFCSAML